MLAEPAIRGRLVRLELENFKSYNGRQIIGPFTENFVSVIGPNGAGKSNLMDALSFVLGIQSAHLRSQCLADLIYRRGEVAGEGSSYAKHASVTAVYQLADGKEILFTRRVNRQGVSDYLVDGRSVSYSEYCKLWENENVLIKARNFLVFQGDVEALANKSPRDLTKLFEQISGSDEFKAEYERLRGIYEKAADESCLNYNKKRGLGAELKQVQEQREDVERFEELSRQRCELQCEYYLWKLFHLEENARKIGADIEKNESDLASSSELVKQTEAEWKEAKKAQAKVQKDILAIEKKYKSAQKDVTQYSPDYLKLSESLSYSNKQLSTANDTLQKTSEEVGKYSTDCALLESEIGEVMEAASRFEESSTQKINSANISPALLEEYHGIKGKVSEETTKDRLKLESAERKMSPELAVKKQLQEKIKELEGAKGRVCNETDSLSQKLSENREAEGALAAEITKIEVEINTGAAKRLKMQQTEVELTEKLRNVMNQLMQAKVDQQESEKEIKLRTTIESLKRMYPGIHGKLIDLCKPTQKRYQTAIAVALGRHLDAIVVETEKTAIACIKYLREQRAGQATFIPLDTIQPSPKKTFNFDGSRSVLEVIKYDSIHEKAFSYACGSAIICDNMNIAKQICFDHGQKVKAITLEGTVIHKSGLMSGGNQGAGNDHRWEEREIGQLRADRDALVAHLSEISKSLRRTEADDKLKQTLVELQTRHGYLKEDIAALERKLSGLQEEEMHISQELVRTETSLNNTVNSLKKFDKEVATITASIYSIEDRYFDAFCKKINFSNIREFESTREALVSEISEKRVHFNNVISKLQNQLQFMRRQEEAAIARCNECRERVKCLQEEVKKYENDTSLIEKEMDTKRSKTNSLKDELAKAKEELKEKEVLVDGKRAALTKAQGKLTDISKVITAHECEIERVLGSRKVLLQNCKMEEVDLPLSIRSGRGKKSFTTINLDEEEAKGTPILFDYSSLSKTLKNTLPSDAGADRKFLTQIEAIQDEMDKLTPNLRSLEKLAGAETRLRTTMDEIEKTKSELRKAKDEFYAIRNKRIERFNTAFKQISATIDPIYKELTRSEKVPMGGSAFLTLEAIPSNTNTNTTSLLLEPEPFSEGIRYHAMPPMKRFLDMEQLSGGERTVAALALLFALHSYRPAPFFILDEIDAALDSANVHRVAEFIKKRAMGLHTIMGNHLSDQQSQSQSQSPSLSKTSDSNTSPLATHPTQFLVISLKASLYAQAGALVGIYRDPEECTSKVLTLSLTEYQS